MTMDEAYSVSSINLCIRDTITLTNFWTKIIELRALKSLFKALIKSIDVFLIWIMKTVPEKDQVFSFFEATQMNWG